jgi:hypothetical protein
MGDDDDSKRGLAWKLPLVKSKELGKIGPAMGYGIGCGFGLGAGIIGGFASIAHFYIHQFLLLNSR